MSFRVRVDIDSRIKEGLRQAPQIIIEELTRGMEQATTEVQTAVVGKIRSDGLVKSGRLLASAQRSVKPLTKNVVGIVQVGGGSVKGARIQEYGGTIRAKDGGFMTIPVKSDWVLITSVQMRGKARGGSWRDLKRPKLEAQTVKFIRVKEVKIKGRHYFRDGYRTKAPEVHRLVRDAAERAMQRVFGGDA
jgi:hypothetical protein